MNTGAIEALENARNSLQNQIEALEKHIAHDTAVTVKLMRKLREVQAGVQILKEHEHGVHRPTAEFGG